MGNNKNLDDISNLNQEKIEELKKKEKADELINNLSNEQKEKLNAILSDKKALESVLKSPKAIALLKLFGGDKNG